MSLRLDIQGCISHLQGNKWHVGMDAVSAATSSALLLRVAWTDPAAHMRQILYCTSTYEVYLILANETCRQRAPESTLLYTGGYSDEAIIGRTVFTVTSQKCL